MSEHEQLPKSDTPEGEQPLDAEALIQLKDTILEQWKQLPAEHQASIGLVLVSSILGGEWGHWFNDALTAKHNVGDTAVSAPFIFSVTPEQLRRVHFTEEEIAQLTEPDRATIAGLIQEHFITDAYWDELAFITDIVLANKKKQNTDTGNSKNNTQAT